MHAQWHRCSEVHAVKSQKYLLTFKALHEEIYCKYISMMKGSFFFSPPAKWHLYVQYVQIFFFPVTFGILVFCYCQTANAETTHNHTTKFGLNNRYTMALFQLTCHVYITFISNQSCINGWLSSYCWWRIKIFYKVSTFTILVRWMVALSSWYIDISVHSHSWFFKTAISFQQLILIVYTNELVTGSWSTNATAHVCLVNVVPNLYYQDVGQRHCLLQ